VHGRSRLASVVVTAALALFCSAAPAFAHAEVTATSPQSGSTVHGNLTRISVTFSEAVTLVPHALRLTTDAGIPVNLETARLSHGGTVLSANVQDHLAAGHYAVAWRVQSDDGHLESSTFAFTIAAAGKDAQHSMPAAAPAPTPSGPDEPLWPVLVAAGVALAGGLGAGLAVRRGLALAAARTGRHDGHAESPPDHESLRLPM